MPKPQPHVVGFHTKRIARATAKLKRRQALVAEALQERDAAIRDAYAAGVQGEPVRKAADLRKDRVLQILHGRR